MNDGKSNQFKKDKCISFHKLPFNMSDDISVTIATNCEMFNKHVLKWHSMFLCLKSLNVDLCLLFIYSEVPDTWPGQTIWYGTRFW